MIKNPLEKYNIRSFHYRIFAFLCILFFQNSFSQALQATSEKENQIITKRLVKNYYPNGKIKEKGYQGFYEDKEISTGAFVGTWYLYDINGKLIESTYYHNDIISKAYIEKKKYYPNGKVKSIEKFNNYELYESEIDSIGTWMYFDQKGRLTKKVPH